MSKLLNAVLVGNLQQVKLLLTIDNFHRKYMIGWTALHNAVSLRQTDIVKYLLQFALAHKSNINCQDNLGYTPLHKAMSKGYIAIVKYLLQHGARLDIKNNWGYAPGEREKTQHPNLQSYLDKVRPYYAARDKSSSKFNDFVSSIHELFKNASTDSEKTVYFTCLLLERSFSKKQKSMLLAPLLIAHQTAWYQNALTDTNPKIIKELENITSNEQYFLMLKKCNEQHVLSITIFLFKKGFLKGHTALSYAINQSHVQSVYHIMILMIKTSSTLLNTRFALNDSEVENEQSATILDLAMPFANTMPGITIIKLIKAAQSNSLASCNVTMREYQYQIEQERRCEHLSKKVQQLKAKISEQKQQFSQDLKRAKDEFKTKISKSEIKQKSEIKKHKKQIQALKRSQQENKEHIQTLKKYQQENKHQIQKLEHELTRTQAALSQVEQENKRLQKPDQKSNILADVKKIFLEQEKKLEKLFPKLAMIKRQMQYELNCIIHACLAVDGRGIVAQAPSATGKLVSAASSIIPGGKVVIEFAGKSLSLATQKIKETGGNIMKKLVYKFSSKQRMRDAIKKIYHFCHNPKLLVARISYLFVLQYQYHLQRLKNPKRLVASAITRLLESLAREKSLDGVNYFMPIDACALQLLRYMRTNQSKNGTIKGHIALKTHEEEKLNDSLLWKAVPTFYDEDGQAYYTLANSKIGSNTRISDGLAPCQLARGYRFATREETAGAIIPISKGAQHLPKYVLWYAYLQDAKKIDHLKKRSTLIDEKTQSNNLHPKK